MEFLGWWLAGLAWVCVYVLGRENVRLYAGWRGSQLSHCETLKLAERALRTVARLWVSRRHWQTAAKCRGHAGPVVEWTVLADDATAAPQEGEMAECIDVAERDAAIIKAAHSVRRLEKSLLIAEQFRREAANTLGETERRVSELRDEVHEAWNRLRALLQPSPTAFGLDAETKADSERRDDR